MKNQEICADCKTKECIQKKRQYYVSARFCTSNLYPPRIKDNRKCLLCSQCLSSCPNDNLVLKLRRPLSDFTYSLRLSFSEIRFIIIVSGFIICETFSEWNVTKAMLLFLPNMVSNLLGITGMWRGSIKALILFVLFPTLFLLFWEVLGKSSAMKNPKIL